MSWIRSHQFNLQVRETGVFIDDSIHTLHSTIILCTFRTYDFNLSELTLENI